MCYHERNLCDLHPVCDDAEDEDWSKCAEKYKDLFKKEATFRCQSLDHNEDTVKANRSKGIVWINAVPQDGVQECWKNADEQPTDWYVTIGIPGNIFRRLLSSFNLMIWFLKNLVFAFPYTVCFFQLRSLSPVCSSHNLLLQCLRDALGRARMFQHFRDSALS